MGEINDCNLHIYSIDMPSSLRGCTEVLDHLSEHCWPHHKADRDSGVQWKLPVLMVLQETALERGCNTELTSCVSMTSLLNVSLHFLLCEAELLMCSSILL